MEPNVLERLQRKTEAGLIDAKVSLATALTSLQAGNRPETIARLKNIYDFLVKTIYELRAIDEAVAKLELLTTKGQREAAQETTHDTARNQGSP